LPPVAHSSAPKVPPVGANCKLVHPEDDLSLVSSQIKVHFNTW